MGQITNAATEASSFMPWVSFAAGLGGGLHCVGMCGGLVTASCSGNGDIVRYQLGRLVSYVLLGALAGVVGGSFRRVFDHPGVGLAGGILLGGMFIFWGLEAWRGRKGELPLPRFLYRSYQALWGRLVRNRTGMARSFLIGLLSILLPCGLLYGVVLGTVALQDPWVAMASMVFFWLGTLPSMILAPQLLQRIFRPLKAKIPKIYGSGLLILGLLTIGWRVGQLAAPTVLNSSKTAPVKRSCH